MRSKYGIRKVQTASCRRTTGLLRRWTTFAAGVHSRQVRLSEPADDGRRPQALPRHVLAHASGVCDRGVHTAHKHFAGDVVRLAHILGLVF